MLSAGIEPMQNVERLVVSALLDIDAGEGFGEEALFAILGAVVGALVDLGHKLGCLVENYLALVLLDEVVDKALSLELGCLLFLSLVFLALEQICHVVNGCVGRCGLALFALRVG